MVQEKYPCRGYYLWQGNGKGPCSTDTPAHVAQRSMNHRHGDGRAADRSVTVMHRSRGHCLAPEIVFHRPPPQHCDEQSLFACPLIATFVFGNITAPPRPSSCADCCGRTVPCAQYAPPTPVELTTKPSHAKHHYPYGISCRGRASKATLLLEEAECTTLTTNMTTWQRKSKSKHAYFNVHAITGHVAKSDKSIGVHRGLSTQRCCHPGGFCLGQR